MFSENLNFKFVGPPKQYNMPPEIGGEILINDGLKINFVKLTR